MKRIWAITNAAAGTASEAAEAHVLSFCNRDPWQLQGCTRFPQEALPAAADLDTAEVDIVVVFGGDGTHAAAARHLAGWPGALLLLPGGTVNLAPKRLHGDAHFIDVLDRAASQPLSATPLPFIDVGGIPAYSGLIAGPIAGWVHARERVRAGRWRSLVRAVRFAWSLSFTRRISLSLGVMPRKRARGIVASPPRDPDGEIEIAAIDFRGFWSAMSVGIDWLKHGFDGARGISRTSARSARLAGPARMRVLIDGEEHHLPTPVGIETRTAAVRFVTTRTNDEGRE
ncbi:diacylglycerol/lipid kinase family protein [Pacificimonas flava]|nr:diacylglycerol kinase family protein [Pacificimonas flava]MBB5279591.1 diacylglycerol kinase family enzyme [Pacificimonas flava]